MGQEELRCWSQLCLLPCSYVSPNVTPNKHTLTCFWVLCVLWGIMLFTPGMV